MQSLQEEDRLSQHDSCTSHVFGTDIASPQSQREVTLYRCQELSY